MKNSALLSTNIRARLRNTGAVLLSASSLLVFAPAARAVNVNPGATQALGGTTLAANPDLLGSSVGGDRNHPFVIRDTSNNIVMQGDIQERVSRSTNLGTLIFQHRLRNLTGPAGARVTGVDRDGFHGVSTNIDWRSDGLGDVGPDAVTRSSDGDLLSFRHNPSVIAPPDEGYFTFSLTDVPDYDLTGRITIYAQASPTSTVYRTILDGVASPGVLDVNPGQSIQSAIDHALPGETVSVSPGAYNEDLTLRGDIDVLGSGADTTILTGTGTGPVVTATTIGNMEFSGFTVQGSGTGDFDTGFTIISSNIVIRNNTITGNTIGIRTSDSTSFICSNLITGNGNAGNTRIDHAIYCSGNDLFAGNRVVGNEGGPIASGSTGSQFVNNTIADNGWWGFQASNATTTVKNNIISGNTSGGIFSENDSVIESTYNCIFGNGTTAYSEIRGGTITSRLGDILVDPGFDPAQPGAYFLSESSPCIDAGDPAAIYNDINGSRNDIGASGGLCGAASPPGSIISGFVWTSIGTYANIEDIEQSGAKRGLTKVRDRPFGGSPWLYGAFGFSETGIFRYAVKIAKWTGGTPPLPGDFEYVDDPLSKVRFDISGGTLATSRVALGPFEFAGRPTYQLTRNSGNVFWSHENLRMVLNTISLEKGVYSVRMEALDSGGSAISFTVNQDIIMTVNNTRPVVSIDSVSYNGGPPFTECSFIRLPGPTSTLDFEYTAHHADGFLDDYQLVVEFGRNRSGGNIVTDTYSNHIASDGSWEGETNTMVAATPVSPGQALPNLQLWETCAYQFRIRAWARTTNGFGRLYWTTFFDTYVIDLTPLVVSGPDLDGDGDVDAQDLAILAAAYGTAR